ncbi:MAG: hypothetical protein ACYDDE_00510 [bacterium]
MQNYPVFNSYEDNIDYDHYSDLYLLDQKSCINLPKVNDLRVIKDNIYIKNNNIDISVVIEKWNKQKVQLTSQVGKAIVHDFWGGIFFNKIYNYLFIGDGIAVIGHEYNDNIATLFSCNINCIPKLNVNEFIATKEQERYVFLLNINFSNYINASVIDCITNMQICQS